MTEQEKNRQRAQAEERRKQHLAKAIREDFERRREERRAVESGWLLNMRFFSGEQYCDVSPRGGVEEEEKRFYWQPCRVFNHIAPLVDARVAKLENLRPVLRVRAFSDEDGDVKSAKMATGILEYVQQRVGLSETISSAIVWAETCGSAFYKVLWNADLGRQVAVDENGNAVFEGEVEIVALPPFEIYPDKLNAETLEDVQSLIHAKAVSKEYVLEKFGVAVDEEDVSAVDGVVYSKPSAGLQFSGGLTSASMQTGVILMERYTRPSQEFPEGRLEIAAGGKLLFEGPLPYINGERGARVFPFVKQDCLRLPGAFFATSVIDRMIPVQRAYNAVRNRKHEFLNRISMGVLTVEDGSIDTDELSEEGLLPGKVIVYRQGSKPPEMLDCGNVPAEFSKEEEWLEKEFSLISGISDLSQNSTPSTVTSATGLQLLLAQDESRLSSTLSSMERAVKEVGRQILRLYKQFAGSARLMTLTGENKKTQVYYFNANELSVSDLQFETQETSTPEEKKATILRLFEAGLLTDENGEISAENKQRILQAFGFGSYENAQDISALHIAKAAEENLLLKEQEVEVDEYDEHRLHIAEHVRFLLSEAFKKCKDKQQAKARYVAHIAAHKKAQANENE